MDDNVKHNTKDTASETNTTTTSSKSVQTETPPTTPDAAVAAVHSHVGKVSSATPTLAQIGRQPSVNFRLSQISDSGAESCDADEQTRLIRTPSSRSHKFIIIPSTSATSSANVVAPSNKKPFRQTFSTTSLTSLAASLQKVQTELPPTSLPAVEQQQLQRAEPSSKSRSQSNFNANTAEATQTTPATTTTTTTPTRTKTQSDVIHHDDHQLATTSNAAAAAAATVPSTASSTTTRNSGVTFTIEDCCDSDNTLCSDNILNGKHPIISTIDSALHFTPTTLGTVAAITSNIGGGGGNSGVATLRVGLGPRNSSMRSVVSAYIPGTTLDPSHQNYFQQQQQYLKPNASFDCKDLSASSYLYHDQAANQIYSDVTSVRSLASIGIGSTDGKRLVIRRVPHTATELFSLVNPPTPPPAGLDDDDADSFLDMSDETANLKPRQQHWANKMQFVLACIGYSVGLGNVWRFPYMCYKSGGGVFLVPYCIILFVCSIPLLFMELSIGQYTGRGPIGALGQLCPLFKGAGLASVVVSFLMSTYYSVIIGYTIYYFFTSFKPFMPWTDCSNRWNTPDCWVPQFNITSPPTSRTPSEEFFENKVLQISPGIEYPGAMRWELFVCLICAWLMVYFATWKSIKSSAKVRYFTATFPFVLIIILMGRAVTLEGADAGLRYFFRPNWSELKNANVWINAASQNFNSLGITFGSMISFASYNKYNNNILRDTISVSVVNILTSLLVGVFAFATLGNLALEQNTNVKDVISDGPGLIFVVYPQAMAKMPYAQLWAVMFFFMLLCLGLNSQFAIVEVVVTSIQDGFPNWIKRHLGYHEVVVLIVCVVSFLFGLPNLIQGGIYFFQLMDHYAASVSIMFLAFCQMIAVAWLYGTGRLSKNVKQMTGKAPSFYLKFSWIILGPCLLFAIWILSLINYQEPSYHNGRYKYPEWAYGIGWMFASFSLICIPGYAVITLLRSSGDTLWERVRNTLVPNIYECRICGEHHCEHDFPEQEQFMLAQEMAGIYKPGTQISASTTPLQLNQKSGYNPMQLQQQTEYIYNENSEEQQTRREVPSASTSTEKAH